MLISVYDTVIWTCSKEEAFIPEPDGAGVQDPLLDNEIVQNKKFRRQKQEQQLPDFQEP